MVKQWLAIRYFNRTVFYFFTALRNRLNRVDHVHSSARAYTDQHYLDKFLEWWFGGNLVQHLFSAWKMFDEWNVAVYHSFFGELHTDW